MEGGRGGLRWKLGIGKNAHCCLLNIYLMGMVEELERAQLRVKLDGYWCRALMYAKDV